MEAFVLDQLFDAINHKDVPIIVYVANVASMEPSIVVNCSSCLLLVLIVACKVVKSLPLLKKKKKEYCRLKWNAILYAAISIIFVYLALHIGF